VWLYVPVQQLARKLQGSIHYDSVLFTVLALSYPLYLLGIMLVLFFSVGIFYASAVGLVLPLLARSYTLWK
jgi:hypothetical protein